MGVSFKPSKEHTYTTDYEFEYTFTYRNTDCRFLDKGGYVRLEAWCSAGHQYTHYTHTLHHGCPVEHYVAFLEERAKVL